MTYGIPGPGLGEVQKTTYTLGHWAQKRPWHGNPGPRLGEVQKTSNTLAHWAQKRRWHMEIQVLAWEKCKKPLTP